MSYLFNCQECNKEKTSNYRQIFCSLSCQITNRTRKEKEIKEELYSKNPKKCLYCENVITYSQHMSYKKGIYCSKRCSALSTGPKKDWSKITTGPKTYYDAIKHKPFCAIYYSHCIICGDIFVVHGSSRKRKTCGTKCKNILHGNMSRDNIKCGGSTKQFIDYKGHSLDSSWELEIAKSLDENSIYWERPKHFKLSDGRRYTPDFYLPDYKIYLDPKAYRKGYTIQINKIHQFEAEYNTRCIVLSNKKLLNWPAIKDML